MYIEYMDSPIGVIEITATETGIASVYFVEATDQRPTPNALTALCKKQLLEYFASDRKSFDLPFDQKGTDFQTQVWDALLTIPFGQLATYRDIANTIMNPKAVRAVGAANGRNPISIIVPCHRVIGSNGTLTGYAGGLERKQWLLQHEAKLMFK